MSKKLSKELREWVILLGVLAVLFWTGWYKDVAGLLQRGLLETGIMQPSISKITKPTNFDFILKDVNGNIHEFSQFKGKTIFVNFWATWCPPCIAEMPDIHNLYKKIGDKVVFVMISVDDTIETANSFVEKKEFDFPIYSLATKLPSEYQTSSIPTTYVISPQGEIVVEEHGLSKYDTEKFRNFLLRL